MMAIQYWRIDNTGWSNGISWFKGDRRYETAGDALRAAEQRKKEFNDDRTLWRVVQVRVMWDNTQTVTIEIYTEV